MGIFRDLVGQQSGTLVAQKYIGNSKWLCRCLKCGSEVEISTNWFKKNRELGRDGCKHQLDPKPGDVFGCLTVVARTEDYIKPKTGYHEKCWKCKCICGREKDILQSNLKSGKSITCGLCSNRISIPEKMIYYYLAQIFDDIEENYRPDFLKGKEIDIYIPSLKLGIEYDGERWHKDFQSDLDKNNLCIEHGINIIRIREPKCLNNDQLGTYIVTPRPTTNGTHMTEPIKQLIEILHDSYQINSNINIDCSRDNADICKSIVTTAGYNSLALKYPEIAKEWDYVKNSPLTPDNISAHSGKKAWWICPKGHSYSSVIASRSGNDKCGCPICSNRGRVMYSDGIYIGTHSLAAERPDIAAEFMEEKNGITAQNISVQSNKKMWFRCSKCGHEWQSKVNNRTSSNNQGCPVCAKEKVNASKRKAVICIETNSIYKSITEAGKQLGISRAKISTCCKDKKKTAGGYHWQYWQEKEGKEW